MGLSGKLIGSVFFSVGRQVAQMRLPFIGNDISFSHLITVFKQPERLHRLFSADAARKTMAKDLIAA